MAQRCDCTLYSSEEPDQLRGPQHEAAWVDELAKFDSSSGSVGHLQFGLRLGPKPRTLITTTPRPRTAQGIITDPKTHVTRGRTLDNAANLPPVSWRAIMDAMPAPGLVVRSWMLRFWRILPARCGGSEDIDAARVTQAPSLQRIVVAVDPA